MLEIERWKTGATFAYSVIYENAFEVLLRHAVPMHDEFLMPASVAVVAGQIGQIHNVPGSPYHLLHRHMDVRELMRLAAKGWSISSHSMTHGDVAGNLYQEVAGSRAAIEEALETDVTSLVLPESDAEIVNVGVFASRHGYLSMFTWHDHLNLPDDDLFSLGRTPLIEEGPRPRRRKFDPYDRLALAREMGGWVVDSTQYATPEPICPEREITPASLARRFEKVRDVGGGSVWCATPEEVADYILTRRATKIAPGAGGQDGNEYELVVAGLDPHVRRRSLTFRVSGLRDAPNRRETVLNLTERREIPPFRVTAEAIWFEVEVADGLRLRVPDA